MPPDVRVHVLPSGEDKLPLMSMRALPPQWAPGSSAAIRPPEYLSACRNSRETPSRHRPPGGPSGPALRPAGRAFAALAARRCSGAPARDAGTAALPGLGSGPSTCWWMRLAGALLRGALAATSLAATPRPGRLVPRPSDLLRRTLALLVAAAGPLFGFRVRFRSLPRDRVSGHRYSCCPGTAGRVTLSHWWKCSYPGTGRPAIVSRRPCAGIRG